MREKCLLTDFTGSLSLRLNVQVSILCAKAQYTVLYTSGTGVYLVYSMYLWLCSNLNTSVLTTAY